jgi:hypothetical protein
MKTEFIPYEQALEFKELGFDEPCFGWYSNMDGNVFRQGYCETYLGIENCAKAPLYQQAFRWLREKYNILGIVAYCDDDSGKFMSVIDKPDSDIDYDMNPKTTYEEAELACLIRLIEIVKNEKQ